MAQDAQAVGGTKSKQTSFNACATGVIPKRSHGFGVYKGERKPWGVRVDFKLLREAKPILRRRFGSDCRAVEAWLSALVATEKGSRIVGASPTNTVEIGTLVIERNLRSRRKLVVEEETTETVKVERCTFCTGKAAIIAIWKRNKTEHALCPLHADIMAKSPNWRLTEQEVGK